MLKFIHQLNKYQLKQLYQIVNSDDMINIGNGKKWNNDKINDIIKYSKNDYDNKFKNSKYMYVCLIKNNNVIGLSYIHPGINNYNNYLQLAIIINNNYKHKGYSKILLNELINIYNKYFNNKLISIVNIYNIPSNKLFKSYKLLGQLMFNNKKYNVYRII